MCIALSMPIQGVQIKVVQINSRWQPAVHLHIQMKLKPVPGDCCCHRQFAAIWGKPEILKAPPEGLKPLLVWLVHLCDVKTSAEHFVSRGEHDGLEYCYYRILCIFDKWKSPWPSSLYQSQLVSTPEWIPCSKNWQEPCSCWGWQCHWRQSQQRLGHNQWGRSWS